MKIKIEKVIDISDQQISDQLCNALEGGSNYWYFLPDLTMLDSDTKLPLVDRIMNALNQGKSIPIYDLEDEEIKLGDLNLKGIEKAFNIMDELFPHTLEEIIHESGDVDTGDIFLQLAVMGEIVFG